MTVTTDFLVVYIVLIHFLADFGLQTHEQATKKSTDVKFLTYHVLVYTSIWFIATIPILGFAKAWFFMAITGVTHFSVDYCTSRIGKPFWDKQDFHNGFTVVGYDQVLHFLQLWYTFKLLL